MFAKTCFTFCSSLFIIISFPKLSVLPPHCSSSHSPNFLFLLLIVHHLISQTFCSSSSTFIIISFPKLSVPLHCSSSSHFSSLFIIISFPSLNFVYVLWMNKCQLMILHSRKTDTDLMELADWCSTGNEFHGDQPRRYHGQHGAYNAELVS